MMIMVAQQHVAESAARMRGGPTEAPTVNSARVMASRPGASAAHDLLWLQGSAVDQ